MTSMFYIFILITKISEIRGSLQSLYVYIRTCVGVTVGMYRSPPALNNVHVYLIMY